MLKGTSFFPITSASHLQAKIDDELLRKHCSDSFTISIPSLVDGISVLHKYSAVISLKKFLAFLKLVSQSAVHIKHPSDIHRLFAQIDTTPFDEHFGDFGYVAFDTPQNVKIDDDVNDTVQVFVKFNGHCDLVTVRADATRTELAAIVSEKYSVPLDDIYLKMSQDTVEENMVVDVCLRLMGGKKNEKNKIWVPKQKQKTSIKAIENKIENKLERDLKRKRSPTDKAQRLDTKRLKRVIGVPRGGQRSIARELVEALTLPGEPDTVAVRAQTGFNASKTALCKVHTRADVTLATSAQLATYPPLNCLTQDSCAMWVFRDPVRHLVYWDPNASKQTYQYVMNFMSTVNPNTIPTTSIPSLAVVDGETVAPVIYCTSASTYIPHGTVLPSGRCDGGDYYVFMMRGSYLNLSFVGGGTIQIIPRLANANTVNKLAASVPLSTGQNWEVTYTGYYQISLRAATATATSIQITLNYNSAVFDKNAGVYCHKMMTDFALESRVMKAIRFLGVAAKVTPIYPSAAKGGIFYSKQYKQDTDWWTTPGDPIANLVQATAQVADLNDNEGFVGERGIYTYVKPTDLADFVMNTGWGTNAYATYSTYTFEVQPQHDYVGFFGTIPASSFGDRVFKYSCYVIGDYGTDSQYRLTKGAKTKAFHLQNAIVHLTDRPQTFENLTHVSQIMNMIKSFAVPILDGVIKYGPEVIKGAQFVRGIIP